MGRLADVNRFKRNAKFEILLNYFSCVGLYKRHSQDLN